MPSSLTNSWAPVINPKFRYVFVLVGLVLIGGLWFSNEIVPDKLVTDVNQFTVVAFFETKWLYTYLLVFTGIFPLLFGFIPRPRFYEALPAVFLANIPVTILFILWDIYFTKHGVWGFSETYTSGFRPFGLPWEECAFFIIIPMSCTFIYWSLNSVIPKEPFAKYENKITVALIMIFFMVGLWKWEHIYTATATLISGSLLLFHLLFIKPGYRGRFYLAYIITCIPFLFVNGVLTGGFTEGPVVMYNPDENFGVRVGTVPVDDFAYSFAMLFANISLFEFFQKKRIHSHRGS